MRRLYRTRLSGQQVALCGALEGLLLPSDAHLGWAAIPVLLDQPLGVVAGDEGSDSVTHVLDGLEDATMDGLLFQGSEQPLDHAVGLGFRDEGIARRQAQNLTCFWKTSAMKLLPWSWRSARPRAAPALRWPNCWRTAMPRAWIAS